jgi:gliding motility-associated-like protein
MRWYFVLFLIFWHWNQLCAQSYFTNGDAKKIQGQCYELTLPRNFQNGSVWYAEKLNLEQNIDLEFELNFGNIQNGADGIMFVLQNRGINAIGNAGGGLGFEGFTPSLGVEFDTYQNGDRGDPTYDHIAVVSNGNVRHSGATSIVPPVQASAVQPNIKDGQNHKVRIFWNAITFDFEVWFDCTRRVATKIDLKKTIFSGVDEIFWGFTASTGGSVNRQVACLREDIILNDTVRICQGASFMLNARVSADNNYTWMPNDAIDNPLIKRPTVSPLSSQLYTVSLKNWCNDEVVDSVYVLVSDSILDYQFNDTLLCQGASVTFDIEERYEKFLWNDGVLVLPRTIQDSGRYNLRIYNGPCQKDIKIYVQTDSIPEVEISGDSVICEGELANLGVKLTPTYVNFNWNDGVSSVNQRKVGPGYYSVSAQNQCGFSDDYYVVREIVIPNISLGENTKLCEGEAHTIDLSTYADFQIRWNDGSTDVVKKIENTGRYTVTIFEKQCQKTDSTYVLFETVPRIVNLASNIEYCSDQTFTQTINIHNATEIIWDDEFRGKDFSFINREGPIWVKVKNECGIDSHRIMLQLVECSCTLLFPNIFSPNDDNLNDVFRPIVMCKDIDMFEFRIYNRWGELLFISADINKGWDGRYKNSMVAPGVYHYTVSYRGNLKGFIKPFFQSGIVHVNY